MKAIDITTLEASVETLIQQQVAEYEAQLRAALGRRLSSTGKPTSGRPKARPSGKASSTSAPRRSPEELQKLAERFFDAVEATPGETMINLAGKLELGARELDRPVQRLKRAGRIRTVGERNRTRYYPMTPRSA